MTYGIAIPRFKPRPTLDNLRDPVVPFGPSRHAPPPLKTINNALNLSAAAASATAASSAATTESTAAAATPRRAPPVQRRSCTPIRTSLTDERRTSAANSRQSSPKPHAVATTDAFGYASTTIGGLNQPQIFLEPPTPSVLSDATGITGSPTFSRGGGGGGGYSNNNNNTTNTSTLPPAKPKHHKLHLHLPGRLGRSKAAQSPEPARLRNVTDIHISNPTFTSENLLARNYDAFFESGEPVYSLEQRSASPVADDSVVLPDDTLVTMPASPTESRSRTLGLFHRKAKAPAPAPPVAAAAHSPRAHSVDRTQFSDTPQKGDAALMLRNAIQNVPLIAYCFAGE